MRIVAKPESPRKRETPIMDMLQCAMLTHARPSVQVFSRRGTTQGNEFAPTR